MANFEIAFKKSATNEGGYVNDPNDTGGETYRGISRVYNPTWNGWKVIDSLKPSGVIKKHYINSNLDALANSFYKAKYWNPLKLDEVSDQSNANQIYDSTLSGLHRTTQMIKKVLNDSFGKNFSLNSNVDSSLVDSLNNVNQADFHDKFRNLRADLFTYSAAKLPTTNPNYSFFKKFNPNPKASNAAYSGGWANRVNKYVYEGVSSVLSQQAANLTATVAFAKRNWIPITISVIGLAGLLTTVIVLMKSKTI